MHTKRIVPKDNIISNLYKLHKSLRFWLFFFLNQRCGIHIVQQFNGFSVLWNKEWEPTLVCLRSRRSAWLAKCLAILKEQHVFNSAGVRKSSAQYSLDRVTVHVAKPKRKATAVSWEEFKKKNQRKLKHLRIYLNFRNRNKVLSWLSGKCFTFSSNRHLHCRLRITWKYMILHPVPEVALQQLCGVSSPELNLAN